MEDISIIRPQLTKLDYDEGYITDTLTDALAHDLTCYHLCRISLIYLSNTGLTNLTNQDVTENLIKLMAKIVGNSVVDEAQQNKWSQLFGTQPVDQDQREPQREAQQPVDEDYGWLERQSGSKDAPINYFLYLREFYAQTVLKEKVSRQTLGAYRLCELLDPFIEGSLVDVLFRQQVLNEQSQNTSDISSLRRQSSMQTTAAISLIGTFVCYVKLEDLSHETQKNLTKLFQTNQNQLLNLLPNMLKGILMNRSKLIRSTEEGVLLPFNFQEYFLFALFHWFTSYSKNNYNAFQHKFGFYFKIPKIRRSSHSFGTGDPTKKMDLVNIYSLMNKSVPLHVFYRLLPYFLPYNTNSAGPGIETACEAHKVLFLELLVEKVLRTGSGGHPEKFKELTVTAVQLLFVLIVYCFLHVPLRDEAIMKNLQAAHVAAGNLRREITQASIGVDALTPHFYSLFLLQLKHCRRDRRLVGSGNGLAGLSIGLADMSNVVSLLMVYLSPWNASAYSSDAMLKSRYKTVKASLARRKSETFTGFNLQDIKNMDKYVRDQIQVQKNRYRNAGKGSQSKDTPFENVLFVVKHASFYNQLLAILLTRLNESSLLLKEVVLLLHLFGPSPSCVYNDHVLAILLLLDVISKKLSNRLPSATETLSDQMQPTLFSGMQLLEELDSTYPYFRRYLRARPGVLKTIAWMQDNLTLVLVHLQQNSTWAQAVHAPKSELALLKSFQFFRNTKPEVEKLLVQLYLYYNDKHGIKHPLQNLWIVKALDLSFLFEDITIDTPEVKQLTEILSKEAMRACILRMHAVFDIETSGSSDLSFKDGLQNQADQGFVYWCRKLFGLETEPAEQGRGLDVRDQIYHELLEQAQNPDKKYAHLYFNSYEVPWVTKRLISGSDHLNRAFLLSSQGTTDAGDQTWKFNLRPFGDVRRLLVVISCLLALNIMWFRNHSLVVQLLALLVAFASILLKELEVMKLVAILFSNWTIISSAAQLLFSS